MCLHEVGREERVCTLSDLLWYLLVVLYPMRAVGSAGTLARRVQFPRKVTAWITLPKSAEMMAG